MYGSKGAWNGFYKFSACCCSKTEENKKKTSQFRQHRGSCEESSGPNQHPYPQTPFTCQPPYPRSSRTVWWFVLGGSGGICLLIPIPQCTVHSRLSLSICCINQVQKANLGQSRSHRGIGAPEWSQHWGPGNSEAQGASIRKSFGGETEETNTEKGRK